MSLNIFMDKTIIKQELSPEGAVVSTSASKKVLGLMLFCVEFAYSPHVRVGSLRVQWLLPTVQRHAVIIIVPHRWVLGWIPGVDST